MADCIDKPFGIKLPLLGIFLLDIVGVPFTLPRDDDSSQLDRRRGTVWFNVFNIGDRQFVGCARFGGDRFGVRCEIIIIDHRVHYSGIREALYKIAAFLFGSPVSKCDNISSDALFLFTKEDVISVSEIVDLIY